MPRDEDVFDGEVCSVHSEDARLLDLGEELSENLTKKGTAKAKDRREAGGVSE